MAEAVRDYGKLALDVIRLVGGKENITSAARCATRLRLVLKDTPEDAEEKIKALPGVITVVQKQGQFQVVIGNHVGDVFEVVSRELKLEEKEGEQPAQKESLLNRLLQMMSGVFAPICYILAAGGLIQGVLIIVSMLAPSAAETGVYQIFDMISWTPFTFLPVLIAITASRHFKCNTFIAVACCLALVNPTWTEMAGRIAEGESIKFLFVDLTEITYTSSVLPPLVLIAILAVLERFLNKHLPDVIKPLFTPLICLAVMVPLTIVVVGPVIQGVSNAVAAGYNVLYALAPPIAGAVVGGFWEVIVIFGIQWGMVPIVVANFAQNGCDSIQVFIQIAVVSQMAAAFGVFLKTKDKSLKANALSSGITAIFGITEPTIYGITLPRKKPFVYACICAAAGSIVAALFGSMNYVYAGLPGLVSTVNSISPENPNSFIGCMAGCAVAVIGTIALIMIFGYEAKPAGEPGQESAEIPGSEQEKEAEPAPDKSAVETGTMDMEKKPEEKREISVYSPLKGAIKSLKEVNDPTFSEEILGKGLAILPEEGKLYAPFDGEVTSLFDTKHAIGLSCAGGAELLIHIGLETVGLGGRYFEAKAAVGDKVKKGDLLIEFDLEEICKEYDTITPVVITNAEDFTEILQEKEGAVEPGELILTVK